MTDLIVYDGYFYPVNYPREWMENELPNTGRQCMNCVGENSDGYAMWRGVVLGYCANCAEEYGFERGPGFVGCAVEIMGRNSDKSVFKTYLKDVHLENLGYIAIQPEDTMEKREEIYLEEERRIGFEEIEYDSV